MYLFSDESCDQQHLAASKICQAPSDVIVPTRIVSGAMNGRRQHVGDYVTNTIIIISHESINLPCENMVRSDGEARIASPLDQSLRARLDCWSITKHASYEARESKVAACMIKW